MWFQVTIKHGKEDGDGHIDKSYHLKLWRLRRNQLGGYHLQLVNDFVAAILSGRIP